MDTSISKKDRVRAVDSIVHSLSKGRYRTDCGIDSTTVTGYLLAMDDTDHPIDCMTCLVYQSPGKEKEEAFVTLLNKALLVIFKQ